MDKSDLKFCATVITIIVAVIVGFAFLINWLVSENNAECRKKAGIAAAKEFSDKGNDCAIVLPNGKLLEL